MYKWLMQALVCKAQGFAFQVLGVRVRDYRSGSGDGLVFSEQTGACFVLLFQMLFGFQASVPRTGAIILPTALNHKPCA